MLQSVSLSGAITAKKMWELVSKVISSEEDQAAKNGGFGSVMEAPVSPSQKSSPSEEVIGMQEQAAATISDLAYGDDQMQDEIILAGESSVIGGDDQSTCALTYSSITHR